MIEGGGATNREQTTRSKTKASCDDEEDQQAQVQHQERRLEEERKPNPNFGSVYHVMNSTCIHLRARGPNINMYRRGRTYKELPKEIQ
jgi:hypothetical protein